MKKVETYNHVKIEKKWQKFWDEKKTYQTLSIDKAKTKGLKPYYVLDMFPYPSGAGLHVGHPRGYIGSDVFARFKRMQGFNVLHPMGFDSFGLPAEQYAIKTGKHPGPFTDSLVKKYKKQLEIIGFSYDWSREVETHSPEYYKWTQWIFLQLYNSYYDTNKNKAESIEALIKYFNKNGNKDCNASTNDSAIFSAQEWKAFTDKEKQYVLMSYRLAYEGYAEVNWCKELGTVLANDEIIEDKNGNMVSERGEYPVEKKMMRQWFMRITAYADRLLSGLDEIDWSSSIKQTQKNWIGKSEGLIFTAPVKDTNIKIETFSAYFEACFADTFVVIAPNHPLLKSLTDGLDNQREVLYFADNIIKKRNQLGDKYKEVEGIFTGRYIVDPLGNGNLPIWVASFALANYGTGIVKCSCHDERDFAFAKKYGINLKPVLFPENNKDLEEKVRNLEVCFCDSEKGFLVEPKEFNGKNAHSVRNEIVEYLIQKGFARIHTTYKMRDAIFARQRYWGEPIPLIHTKDGLIETVKEKDLPLELPKVKSYQPSGNGESPLASVSSWTKLGYETNTMPGWAGSSWYFLRYMDPKNKKEFASKESLSYWKQVDMYIGGTEHATGHLLYSRFWHKFLKDIGYAKTEEPFKALKNQGLILATDGRKMSKRWGNVINPDEIVKTYGADTLRVYEMFMGPFEASQPWNTESIIGSRRFIERAFRLSVSVLEKNVKVSSKESLRALHSIIEKVTNDIQNFSFNTSISGMMIALNTFEKENQLSKNDFLKFLALLAPFAPHIAEELWNKFGQKGSIHLSAFPKADKKYLIQEEITIPVSVNGKVRAEIIVSPKISEEDIKNIAINNEKVKTWILGQEIKKLIYVPGKIVNIVI